MKIYRAKDGSFHRDAKSAGSGAEAIEFDDKTKGGILDLLARVVPVGARETRPDALPDQSTPKVEERVQRAPTPASGGWFRVYHARDGQVGVFVAGCRAKSTDEAVAHVASELVAYEASR